MGCGSSSTNRTSVFSNGVDNKLPDDLLSDIHGLLLNQDESALQKMLLPLPRSVHISLDKKYGETYNKSLVSLLGDKLLWQLILSPDLALRQLNHLVNEGTTEDVMLILDVFLAAQNANELKTAFDTESPKSISEALATEQQLLHFINTQQSPDKDTAPLKLADGESVEIESEVSYFTKRLRLHLTKEDIGSALFIVIARSEVDLCDIRVQYERLYSEPLTLPGINNIQLLDHTSLKEVSGKDEITKPGLTKPSSHDLTSPDGITSDQAKDAEPANTVTVHSVDGDAKKAPSVGLGPPVTVDTVEPQVDNSLPVLKEEEIVSENERRVAQLRRLHDLLKEEPLNLEEFSDCVVQISSLARDQDPVKMFNEMHQQDLLKTLFVRLPRGASTTVEYLLRDYHQASAALLHRAIEDNDQSTVDLVLMVLLCSDTTQIKDIATAYTEYTGESKSLTDVLTENLMGEFQRFVAALLKGERDESTTQNEEQARADAARLYEATDFKWNGDDNVFNEVFIKRNTKQLQLTFQYFVDESGTDITELILQEFSFHLQKALLNLVYIVNNGLTMFLAKFLHESRTKSHFPSVLVWVIAARYKLDLSNIASEYRSKYDMPITNLLDAAKITEDARALLLKACKAC